MYLHSKLSLQQKQLKVNILTIIFILYRKEVNMIVFVIISIIIIFDYSAIVIAKMCDEEDD